MGANLVLESPLDWSSNSDADLPRFVQHFIYPNVTVADSWSQQGWDITFGRHLNNWEVDRFVDLMAVLEGFSGTNRESDTIKWKHNSDGIFSVSRSYKKEAEIQPQIKVGL